MKTTKVVFITIYHCSPALLFSHKLRPDPPMSIIMHARMPIATTVDFRGSVKHIVTSTAFVDSKTVQLVLTSGRPAMAWILKQSTSHFVFPASALLYYPAPTINTQAISFVITES